MAAPSSWQERATPTMLTPDAQVRDYIERMIQPLSPRRRWHTNKAALRAWYYMGAQWLEIVSDLAPGNGAYHFRQVFKDSLASFKRPVMNITRVAIRNEIARLSKKEYQPETMASKNEPAWIAAARAAKDILVSEAIRLSWGPKREDAVFNFVVDGTLVCRSYWDEVATDLVRIATTGSVTCSACSLTLASDVVPSGFLDEGFPMPAEQRMVPLAKPETVERPEETEGMRAATVRLHSCPICGEPLKQYQVSEDEAAERTDVLGNPFGVDVPRGENALEVVSMHDFYPENGGIRIEPYECKVWQQQTVRSLEWIATRYPEIEKDLMPEEASDLLRYDPLFSLQGFSDRRGAYTSASGMEVYANHARVREVVVAAQRGIPGLEDGAIFTMVGKGDKILKRPLCVEVDGDGGPVKVPRVKYHCARFWRTPGQFFGTTFVDDLIPVNRRLNEIDAQGMDLRERGKPSLFTPKGVELAIRPDAQGSLQLIDYDADASPGWSPRDGLAPAMALSANPYYQERQQCLSDAQILGAPQDIEMGNSPGGVKTTSGLMLVSDQANEKRGPMERGLVGVYQDVYQHILDLTKAFRQENGTYEVQRDSGLYEVRSYNSKTLVGTTRVKVSMRQAYDQALYLKEATAEAIQMGLYQLDSPVARDRALENMRLPKINEESNVQITRAEMAWSGFSQRQEVPDLDSLFDPLVWFFVLHRRWLEDEAFTIQSAVGFPALFSQLTGWEGLLQQQQVQQAQQRHIYGQQPPEMWPTVYLQLQGLYQQAVQGAQVAMQPIPPPPPPPPEGGAIPAQLPLDRQIYGTWRMMLGQEHTENLLALQVTKKTDIEVAPEVQRVAVVDSLLRMRAVIEAFRMLSKVAAPAPAAPGAAPEQAPPQ
jgi:hypothetical protein